MFTRCFNRKKRIALGIDFLGPVFFFGPGKLVSDNGPRHSELSPHLSSTAQPTIDNMG